jgi:cytochrome P450
MYYNIIQERRADPQDDMISDLIAVEVDRDGVPTKLDDVEIAGFASLLGGAGAETVTKLIGNAVVTFAEHPEQWQMLVADRSKIPAAVEELLRWEAPAQYLVRYSMKDVELHGVTIPAGNPVLLCVGSANRDDRAFTDADTFDIDRDRSEAQNVGLGYGVHSCLGAALARMECIAALNKLLDFMPRYEIDEAGLKRVAMTNVIGWHNVPVRVLR